MSWGLDIPSQVLYETYNVAAEGKCADSLQNPPGPNWVISMMKTAGVGQERMKVLNGLRLLMLSFKEDRSPEVWVHKQDSASAKVTSVRDNGSDRTLGRVLAGQKMQHDPRKLPM